MFHTYTIHGYYICTVFYKNNLLKTFYKLSYENNRLQNKSILNNNNK